MSDAYASDDYAGLKGGPYEFYYGYEKTNDNDDWLFVAKVGGVDKFTTTANSLGMEQFDDVSMILMKGIARFFELEAGIGL